MINILNKGVSSFLNPNQGHILYFVGLIFLVFPLVGVLWFDYPLWTLPLTVLFAINYILLIYLRDSFKKIKNTLWVYLLVYIVYMSCFVNVSMTYFFFFGSNLLVWRFKSDWKSIRLRTFLIILSLCSLYIFFTNDISLYIMTFIVDAVILIFLYAQIDMRIKNELQKDILIKNKQINLLLTENERNRIGRDLHDTLGHTFAMMTLKTELALKQLEKDNLDGVGKELRELNQISKDSMTDVRTLVNDLKYRTVSEELDTISYMFDTSEVALTIDVEMNIDALSPVLQSGISMILKELTTNVIKHSKAKTCSILIKKNDMIIIQVEDDGVGFGEVNSDELHSIKERLLLVDGQVSILSRQGPTIVKVSLREGIKNNEIISS